MCTEGTVAWLLFVFSSYSIKRQDQRIKKDDYNLFIPKA